MSLKSFLKAIRLINKSILSSFLGFEFHLFNKKIIIIKLYLKKKLAKLLVLAYELFDWFSIFKLAKFESVFCHSLHNFSTMTQRLGFFFPGGIGSQQFPINISSKFQPHKFSLPYPFILNTNIPKLIFLKSYAQFTI